MTATILIFLCLVGLAVVVPWKVGAALDADNNYTNPERWLLGIGVMSAAAIAGLVAYALWLLAGLIIGGAQ